MKRRVEPKLKWEIRVYQKGKWGKWRPIRKWSLSSLILKYGNDNFDLRSSWKGKILRKYSITKGYRQMRKR